MHHNVARNGKRDGYESRKKCRDGLWSNPKVYTDYNGSSAATYLLPLVKVQRLSPCRRVKPQAYGGRKIRHPMLPLFTWDEYIVYSLFRNDSGANSSLIELRL